MTEAVKFEKGDRVYRAVRRGLDSAHIARVDAEMSK